MPPRLRKSELILLAYFFYLALITPFFHDRPSLQAQPVYLLAAIAAVLVFFAWLETTRLNRTVSFIRDWLPIPLTLIAFREMEWFIPLAYDVHYEQSWIHLDELLLVQSHIQATLGSVGAVLSNYLELCYLLVYGVGTYCVVTLYMKDRRSEIDRFYVVLLTGTLVSYALFPYFPSRPPRIAYPDIATPQIHNVFRSFNLFLLRKATIHTGVFPSAHVSSAFAAAWAMFLVFPDRKRYGWWLLLYAFSVAVATVYGRYHYTADAMAGFSISLIAASVAIYLARGSANLRNSSRSRTNLIA